MYILVLADLSTGLGINTFAFLSQLISFGVVFFILWRWGFPAIIKILDERQAVIREGVENAQQAKRNISERCEEHIPCGFRVHSPDTVRRPAGAEVLDHLIAREGEDLGLRGDAGEQRRQRENGIRDELHGLSLRTATPGNSIPARNSSEAPPPVEM